MEERKTEIVVDEFDDSVTKAIISLAALFGPFLLWPVEQLLPYPAVVEELFKAGLIRYMMQHVQVQAQSRWAALVGLLFGVSESVFFMFNAFQLNDFGALGWRLLLTVPMHMITAYIIYRGFTKKKGWLGVVLAMTVHGGFNLLVARSL